MLGGQPVRARIKSESMLKSISTTSPYGMAGVASGPNSSGSGGGLAFNSPSFYPTISPLRHDGGECICQRLPRELNISLSCPSRSSLYLQLVVHGRVVAGDMEGGITPIVVSYLTGRSSRVVRVSTIRVWVVLKGSTRPATTMLVVFTEVVNGAKVQMVWVGLQVKAVQARQVYRRAVELGSSSRLATRKVSRAPLQG